MSTNRRNCRADVSRVEEILSKAAARPVTAEADEPFTPITPAHVDRMGKTTSILQEIVWETEKGTYGASTLRKKVKHETMCCPDCEIPGRYDDHGDVVCPSECGRIISDTPLMVPEDSFNGRVEGGASGSHGGKPALNPAAMSSPEPNVQ